MLDGLPDRPLFETELGAFTESEAIRFAFPATPESMDTDDDGRRRIYDLLLFLPASVAVLAYEGDGQGWTVVANESGEEPYQAAIDALIDYRDYELEEEGAVRELVEEFYGVTEEHLGIGDGEG